MYVGRHAQSYICGYVHKLQTLDTHTYICVCVSIYVNMHICMYVNAY